MGIKHIGIFLCFLANGLIYSQTSPYVKAISIEDDDNFSGYELIKSDSNQVFVLAEHWHNIRAMPMVTLKMLKYLHRTANVRVLAIEQGTSAAIMINDYLNTGDTIKLRQIIRNTMFWGKEHWEFFENLRAFNQTLPVSERVVVHSIDIEYKMEPAIFVINKLMEGREIPQELHLTLCTFQALFENTRTHREQFQGIAALYYYDKELVENLVLFTLSDLEERDEVYANFFGDDFSTFTTMIRDMRDGLTFDYTNPNNHYKFRDRLIYKKFLTLIEKYPKSSILCVIGMRHTTKGSSIYKLDNLPTSPLKGKVCIIKVSSLLNKMIVSSDLKKFHFNYPNYLKDNDATLIKHTEEDAALRSSKGFDYTLFVNSSGELTPFEKIYKKEYGK